MTRLALSVVVLFVLALGAGVVAGRLWSRLPAHDSAPSISTDDTAVGSPLVEELQLTPTQRDQMRAIWQGVQSKIVDCYNQYDDLQRQRDQDIAKILDPTQKAKFQAIAQNYKNRSDALLRQRQDAFAKAVVATKQILNPGQRKKYEQIIKDRLGPDGLPRGGNSGMGAATESTVVPLSSPTWAAAP